MAVSDASNPVERDHGRDKGHTVEDGPSGFEATGWTETSDIGGPPTPPTRCLKRSDRGLPPHAGDVNPTQSDGIRQSWSGHFEIFTSVTALTRLLASTKSPSRVTDVLRTMLPPPGIVQLWNFSVFGSKRTTVFGVASDSLYQMTLSIAEIP